MIDQLVRRDRREMGDSRPRIEQADLDGDIASIEAKMRSSAFQVAYDSKTMRNEQSAGSCWCSLIRRPMYPYASKTGV